VSTKVDANEFNLGEIMVKMLRLDLHGMFDAGIAQHVQV